MTIVEALKQSRETGWSYFRSGDTGYAGSINYHPTWEYHGLTAEDMTADDWEPSTPENPKRFGSYVVSETAPGVPRF